MDTAKNRQEFLQHLGLTHDPFETPVAEQELGRVHDIFYSYYSPPNILPEGGDILKVLRLPQHAFIFGDPGSGKSTLRLTLEADCRTVLDGTLAVTDSLGEGIVSPLSADEHGAHLAQALTTDLTLAIIEQFNPLTPAPTEASLQALQALILQSGRSLPRLLRILIEKLEGKEGDLDPVWGLSREWRNIGKAPVRYVSGSQELKALLQELLPLETEPAAERPRGWDDFWEAQAVARQWGFRRFLILVDGVDAQARTPEIMMALLSPLLDKLDRFEQEDTFVKCFLPHELYEAVQQHLKDRFGDLYSRAFFSIMSWDESALQRLLAQRFRAASPRSGPPYTGLNSLAMPNLNLDEWVIRAAAGSPRRLLNIISNLIDLHVGLHPDSLRFDQEDWEQGQRILDELF